MITGQPLREPGGEETARKRTSTPWRPPQRAAGRCKAARRTGRISPWSLRLKGRGETARRLSKTGRAARRLSRTDRAAELRTSRRGRAADVIPLIPRNRGREGPQPARGRQTGSGIAECGAPCLRKGTGCAFGYGRLFSRLAETHTIKTCVRPGRMKRHNTLE